MFADIAVASMPVACRGVAGRRCLGCRLVPSRKAKLPARGQPASQAKSPVSLVERPSLSAHATRQCAAANSHGVNAWCISILINVRTHNKFHAKTRTAVLRSCLKGCAAVV